MIMANHKNRCILWLKSTAATLPAGKSALEMNIKTITSRCLLVLAITLSASLGSKALGYTSENYNWGQVPVGGGGNITSLVIHPKVKDVMYIGADVGGVDRWDAANQKWIPTINFYGAPRGCDALAVDPSDKTGNIVWAAMGGADSIPYTGVILKSTDRGGTWVTTSTTRFPNASNADQGWNNRLAVDPANGDVVYFAARNGLWRTIDGGANWTQITDAPNGEQKKPNARGPSGDVMVILDPTSGTLPNPTRTKRVYLSPLGSPLCKSEDGGATWSVMPDAPMNVACAAIDPTGVLYCSRGTVGDVPGGLSKYSGGVSGTWSVITPSKMDGKYWSSIAVDPFNKNNILAFHNYTPCLSNDGGATWPYIAAHGANQSVKATPDWYNAKNQSQFGWGGKNLRFDPFRQGTVWETDCFLPWRTTDIHAKVVHWESFTAGHEETVGTTGMISPSSGPTMLYSSAADVYGFRHTSLTDWPTQIVIKRYNSQLQICGGDFQESDPNFAAFVGEISWDGPGHGGYTTDGGVTFHNFSCDPAKVPNAGGRIAISATSRTMVWATGHATKWGVSYSTDNGATWQPSAGLPERAAFTGYRIFQFMNPLCSDRVNGSKFYIYNFEEASFYRSTDGGASFTKVASKLPKVADANLVPNFTKEGDLWLSAKALGLWHSTDGGETWAKLPNVQNSGMIAIGKGPDSTTPSLYLIGKVDEDPNEHVFRSDDLGKNWIKIDIQRPSPVGWVYMCGDRKTYGTVYIESSTGIFYGQKPADGSQARK